MKIVTSYICPPIPYRTNDWCASFDGYEEDAFFGYGATELEAVNDLLASWPDHVQEVLDRFAPEAA